MTERAWAPEPPWEARTVTVSPVLAFHSLAKAASIARYSSRVGSYETLSSVCALTGAGAPASARSEAPAASASDEPRNSRFREPSRPPPAGAASDFGSVFF